MRRARPAAAAAAAAALLLPCGCTALGDYFDARARDLGDCFKVAVGGGVGLAAEVHVTDQMAPGVGFASYTWNVGYDDRRVNGTWIESDVINTPRFAYEVFWREYDTTPGEHLDEGMLLARLALSSLALPSERWIRSGNELTIEYFSLFNFGGLGSDLRATAVTGHLRREGEQPRIVERSVWQSSSFEVAVTAGVVHARLGFRPLELIDFLAGLFTLDPAHDDRWRLQAAPGAAAGMPARVEAR